MRALRKPTIHKATKRAAKTAPALRLVERTLRKRGVEIFDKAGAKIAIYSVSLDHDGNEEFEAVALILAEQSGEVDVAEFVHLTARCVD